jgi:hypothetical protein
MTQADMLFASDESNPHGSPKVNNGQRCSTSEVCTAVRLLLAVCCL